MPHVMNPTDPREHIMGSEPRRPPKDAIAAGDPSVSTEPNRVLIETLLGTIGEARERDGVVKGSTHFTRDACRAVLQELSSHGIAFQQLTTEQATNLLRKSNRTDWPESGGALGLEPTLRLMESLTPRVIGEQKDRFTSALDIRRAMADYYDTIGTRLSALKSKKYKFEKFQKMWFWKKLLEWHDHGSQTFSEKDDDELEVLEGEKEEWEAQWGVIKDLQKKRETLEGKIWSNEANDIIAELDALITFLVRLTSSTPEEFALQQKGVSRLEKIKQSFDRYFGDFGYQLHALRRKKKDWQEYSDKGIGARFVKRQETGKPDQFTQDDAKELKILEAREDDWEDECGKFDDSNNESYALNQTLWCNNAKEFQAYIDTKEKTPLNDLREYLRRATTLMGTLKEADFDTHTPGYRGNRTWSDKLDGKYKT